MLLFVGARAFQASVATQAPNPSAAANFVKVQAAVIALAHARVIDGTGAPARDDQTIVIRDGTIAEVGPAASTAVPTGATTPSRPTRPTRPSHLRAPRFGAQACPTSLT